MAQRAPTCLSTSIPTTNMPYFRTRGCIDVLSKASYNERYQEKFAQELGIAHPSYAKYRTLRHQRMPIELAVTRGHCTDIGAHRPWWDRDSMPIDRGYFEFGFLSSVGRGRQHLSQPHDWHNTTTAECAPESCGSTRRVIEGSLVQSRTEDTVGTRCAVFMA